MASQRWKRSELLFHTAREMAPEQRGEYLESECGADRNLRDQVAALLASATAAPTFLEPPEIASPSLARETLADALAGREFGNFRLLEVLGRGSSGVVYTAEQRAPSRRVALKILNPLVPTAGLVRRFEREAEILAQLSHPGIAQIYETGTARTSLGDFPYLAMEYIEGLPLDQHVRARRADRATVLKLVCGVCHAVQHAHGKGVIHRDLKPANIIVDALGQPKVVDLGIARVIGSAAVATQALTRDGEFFGTIPYMSPEQLAGDRSNVDTRSDVYALGVIAYQLLCGVLPHALEERNVPQSIHVLLTEAPTPLRARDRSIPEDCEKIVAKATAKDPALRYQSCAELAADIERHLEDQPILARAPSALYLLRKWVRRHRAAAFLASALLISMIGFTVLTWFQSQRVARERDRAHEAEQVAARQLAATSSAHRQAQLAAQTAERVTRMLMDALAFADPRKADRGSASVAAALDATALRIGSELSQEPLAALALHVVLGQTYHSLGDYQKALLELATAVELAQAQHPGDHPQRLQAFAEYGHLHTTLAEYHQAEQALAHSVEIGRRLVAASDATQSDARRLELARSLHYFAKLHHLTAQYRRAEVEWREAIALRESSREHPPADLPANMANLGTTLLALGDRDGAEQQFLAGLAAAIHIYGEDHTDVAEIQNQMARFCVHRGELDRARSLYDQSLPVLRARLPQDHPLIASTLSQLGVLEYDCGDLDRAISHQRRSLELRLASFPPDHPTVSIANLHLAKALAAQGEVAAAAILAEQALDDLRSHLGAEHPQTAEGAAICGQLLVELGKPAEAEPMLRSALSLLMRARSAADWSVGEAQSQLGGCLAALGGSGEAERLLLEGWDTMQAARGAKVLGTQRAVQRIVEFYESWRQPDKAEAWRARLRAVTAKLPSKL